MYAFVNLPLEMFLDNNYLLTGKQINPLTSMCLKKKSFLLFAKMHRVLFQPISYTGANDPHRAVTKSYSRIFQ